MKNIIHSFIQIFFISFLFIISGEIIFAEEDADEVEEEVIKEEKSISPFLNPKKRDPKETTTLPVNKDKSPKILDDTGIRMPQEGEYLGIFTRETTVYGKRGLFSVQYQYEGGVKTQEDEVFLGVIDSPQKLFRSELPQPGITGNSYIIGVQITSSQPIILTPPATIRVPLKQQQYKNTDIATYYFNTEKQEYEEIEVALTEDGKGVLIPMVRDGIFAVFASPGILPKYVDEKTEQDDETSTLKKTEVLPGKKERSFVVSNQYLDIAGHWGEEFIQKLSDVGIAAGKTPKIYGPNEPATRAEIIKMIVEKNFEREEVNECLSAYMPSEFTFVFFTDVPQNHRYANYICMAAVHKMTKGMMDGSFQPDRGVTRAEALKLLYETIGVELISEEIISNPFSDVLATDWFFPAVLRAAQEGITQGFSEYVGDKLHINVDRLHKGDKSEYVETLQKMLTNFGFYSNAITRNLDGQVTNAILQYQLARGIIATPTDKSAGIVGPETIAKLNSDNGTAASPENTKKVFRPHASVTRAELAKFASIIFGFLKDQEEEKVNAAEES